MFQLFEVGLGYIYITLPFGGGFTLTLIGIFLIVGTTVLLFNLIKKIPFL